MALMGAVARPDKAGGTAARALTLANRVLLSLQEVLLPSKGIRDAHHLGRSAFGGFDWRRRGERVAVGQPRAEGPTSPTQALGRTWRRGLHCVGFPAYRALCQLRHRAWATRNGHKRGVSRGRFLFDGGACAAAKFGDRKCVGTTQSGCASRAAAKSSSPNSNNDKFERSVSAARELAILLGRGGLARHLAFVSWQDCAGACTAGFQRHLFAIPGGATVGPGVSSRGLHNRDLARTIGRYNCLATPSSQLT